MSNNIKDLVENPHPIYQNNFHFWNFLLKSYQGGRDYTGAIVTEEGVKSAGQFNVTVNGKRLESSTSSNLNLFKHKKEKDEDFCKRVEISYYYNYCAPIIDIFTDHLFKQPILENFKNIKDIVSHREENIDRMHSSVDEFRKSVADLSQIYGHSYVLVDMPRANNETNLEQRIANDQFPYFVQYHPQNVLNWSLDEFGRPYWVLLRNERDANTDWANFDKDHKVAVSYTMWTRNEWIVFDSEYNRVEESSGKHKVGVVPIVCIKDKADKRVKDFLGISVISDISFIVRDIYNLSSELQEITRKQTFAFLALQGKSADYNDTAVGTNQGLIYPEGTNVPQYVSPQQSNADTLMKQIANQIERAFQLAKLEPGTASFNGQSAVQKSGVSKAWDFNQTNSALSKKSQNLEDGEMKLWQIFSRWENKEFEGNVTYPGEFSIQSLNEDLTEAQELAKLNLGKLVDDEVKAAVIKKKFPRKPDDEITKLINEMKATVTGQPNGGETGNRLFDRLKLKRTENANQGGT